MQITQNNTANAHSILSYGIGKITLSTTPDGQLPAGAKLVSEPDETDKPIVFDWFKSIIVTPSNINTEWKPQHYSELTLDDFGHILERKPEVVLLGTGKTLVFPPREISLVLAKKNIGLEVMDTKAACRTYNFLMNDGRDVAAALFMIQD